MLYPGRYYRGIARPADICAYIPEASKRVIEMQLAELLFYGIIEKFSTNTYPKKSEYSLTHVGKSILPIISHMDTWGLANAAFVKERQKDNATQ